MDALVKMSISFAALMLILPGAAAVNIDGDLADWGVTLNELKDGLSDPGVPGENGNVSAWLPYSGIYFVVEDNRNPGAGSYTGVHISGIGSSYSPYVEDLIGGKPQPIGGEMFDMEAMYLTENSTHIFVAIVYSGDASAIGDLALNLDGDKSTGDYGYEFGVKLRVYPDDPVGYARNYDIYSTLAPNSWTEAAEEEGSPARIVVDNATKVGEAKGYWADTGIEDFGKPNYIIELAIPKSAVGMAGKNLPDQPLPKNIHLTEYCGNDVIEIPIPEFGLMAIPVGIVLGLVYTIRRKF